jgi:hypothetical protein
MKAIRKKNPLPVKGQIIGVSPLAMIGMMVVCTVIFLVCLGLLVLWLFDQTFGIGALIVSLLGLLFGSAGVAGGLWRLGIKERLIFGKDCFQIVQRVRGEDEVTTQIPYANMSTIQVSRGNQGTYIGIDLADLEEANTYQKDDNFSTIKNVRGFHCVIDPGYTEALETIYGMLASRLNR